MKVALPKLVTLTFPSVSLTFPSVGITFPSGDIQKRLLNEVYSEACIDPTQVSYVEAHGTGTKAGDPQEVNTICDVFCKGRKGPLPIGSVKSNMGHSEPASGTDIFVVTA